jgi:hypothetical protein
MDGDTCPIPGLVALHCTTAANEEPPDRAQALCSIEREDTPFEFGT